MHRSRGTSSILGLTVALREHDDREVAIRIRQLPVQLDAMVVAEQSGYGRDQKVFEELDSR